MFLYVLLLNGLSKTFAEMAGITKLDENGKEVTPRVIFIFIFYFYFFDLRLFIKDFNILLIYVYFF